MIRRVDASSLPAAPAPASAPPGAAQAPPHAAPDTAVPVDAVGVNEPPPASPRVAGGDAPLAALSQRLSDLGSAATRAVSTRVSGLLGLDALTYPSLALWPFSPPKIDDPRGALRQMAQGDPDPRRRAVASAVASILDTCRFRETKDALYPLACNGLRGGSLDDAATAKLFARLAKTATAGTSTLGTYIDDQSVVARQGAAFLRDQGETPETRTRADLLAVALSASRFTESNTKMAAVGFAALADRDGTTDASLARLASRLIEAAENADTASGQFQADKSAVANAVLPWLEGRAASPTSSLLLGLAAAATKGSAFATSHEQMALVALGAVRKGDATDKALVKTAAALVKAAHAGDTDQHAYRDDKSGAVLRGAQYIATHAAEPSTKAWITLLGKALDRTSFTRTVTDVAAVSFDRAIDGVEPTPRNQARAALEMLEAAVAGQSAASMYIDDKTRVAGNLLEHLGASAPSPESALIATMGSAALRGARYTEACVAVGKVAFEALTGDTPKRSDVATTARQIIDSVATASAADTGRVAVGVLGTLAGAELRFDRSRLALDLSAEMVKAGPRLDAQTAVAKRALTLWEEADPETPLDPFAWARTLGDAVPDDAARRRVLAGALMALARDRDSDEAETAKKHIDGLWRLGDDGRACASLLDCLSTLERKPRAQQTVERMAEALNKTAAPDAEAPRVEVGDEFVVIGGVRIQKKGGA